MENYIGEIKLFAGVKLPSDWMECDGTLMLISSYQALYSLIGDQYGGDGRTTFALPDLRGRTPVGYGQLSGGKSYTLGSTGGSSTVILTEDTMPAHNHRVIASTDAATTGEPKNNFLAQTVGENNYWEDVNLYINQHDNPTALIMDENSIGTTGENSAHNNLQPYLCLRYIICLNGTYPISK